MLCDSGYHVVVADQRVFPRDKVCGDALIADAIGAMMILGIDGPITREAWRGEELRLYAPDGRHVALRGAFACLPRERFDALLLDAARTAGAAFVTGTAIAPLLDGLRVIGARLRMDGGEVDVRARFTILATGANATALDAFGLAAAKKPDSVAGRAYFEVPGEVAARIRHLTIAYDRDWCPGYGWVFPGPGNRFNVGVGLFAHRGDRGRLREFFDVFCRRFETAAAVVQSGKPISEFRGAPLRSGLKLAHFGRAGLLAAGEAIGTTYAATGEGIGKAMESGLMAAVLIAEALAGERPADGLEHAYRREFRRRFDRRYRAYDMALRWAASPWLLNLLAKRATGGRFLREELEALIAERGDARALFSLPGLVKALLR
jgi:menaquinone-9 beta-reductase